MYDFDENNIYEVILELEKNTEYVYKYRIGPAEETGVEIGKDI